MPRRAYKRCIQVGIISLCSIFFLFGLYPPLYTPSSQREVMVQGWERNVSRNTRDYVLPNMNTTVLGADVCDTDSELLLLVVVSSAAGNAEQRMAIRDTWASLVEPSSRVAFLLGYSDNSTLQARIEEESGVYEDIIQEGFVDSYNNLTIKSVMMLKWVERNCRRARFVLKTDDDIYLNVPALVEALSPLAPPPPPPPPRSRSRQPLRRLLIGSLICRAKPIQDSTNKWYSPQYMFNEPVYPNYLSGTGYLMSRDVVPILYRAALAMPIIHLEDVYITGICARAAGLKPQNHNGFSYQRRRLADSCSPSVFTNHRLSADDLRAAFHTANCSAPLTSPLTPLAPLVPSLPPTRAASAQCH